MGSFFTELKRRHVFKVAVSYAIVAWLIAQVIAVIHEPLHLPESFGTAIIVLLIVGFPLAVILAWAYELTPEGVKRIGLIDKQTDNRCEISDAAASPISSGINSTKQSIAVLPFVDMSPDKDQEYFADGISEELLNQLTKIRDLHVAGRTSSFYFKNKNENFSVIGQQLNVANILEGSVRKAGNRVRITAQLIKVSDGYHLWSESYDRELDDIFAIQEDIAHAVTDALSITLGVGNLGVSTRNIGAYDAYLAGRSLVNQGGRENTSRAIEQLEQAVALDPEFADAWELLATTYYNAAIVFISERAGDLFEKFETAASRAIAIAPEAVASLRAAGQLEVRRHNWSAAEQLLKRAIGLAPSDYFTNDRYSSFLKDVGRVREAIAYDQRAVKIEPLVVGPAQVLGMTHELNGDLDAALQEFERGQGLIGDRAMLNGTTLALAMTMHDRGLMEEYLEKHIDDDSLPPDNRALTTTMRAHLDSPEQAKVDLHRFYQDPAYNNPFIRNVMSVWSSYFGDYELALKIHQELFQSRSFVVYSIWRPIHKPMRLLPGFKDLVRELGLVDYWRTSGKWGEFCVSVGDNDFECE